MNHTIATIDADELRRMFRTVAYAADKKNIRDHHRCVHLAVQDQCLTLTATNGFQLAKAWTMVQAGDTESVGMNVDVLDIAIRMLPKIGIVEIARGDDMITFECDSNTSYVPIVTTWTGYKSIQPGEKYKPMPIDLVSALAECRRIAIKPRRSAVTILEFVHTPSTSDGAGSCALEVRTDTARHSLMMINDLRDVIEPWIYAMQYGFFTKMAAAAAYRNKRQTHRISMRAERLAFVETIDETGHVNAVHMIAPYNDRRK